MCRGSQTNSFSLPPRPPSDYPCIVPWLHRSWRIRRLREVRIPLQFAQVGASENFILVQRTRFRVVVRLPLPIYTICKCNYGPEVATFLIWQYVHSRYDSPKKNNQNTRKNLRPPHPPGFPPIVHSSHPLL